MDEDDDNAGIIGQHSPPALVVGPVRRHAELCEIKVRPEAEPFSPANLAEHSTSWRLQALSHTPYSVGHFVPPGFEAVPAQKHFHSSRVVASQPQCNHFSVAPFQPISSIHQEQREVTTTSVPQGHDHDCETVERSSDSFSQSEFEDARDTSDSISLDSLTKTNVLELPTISNNNVSMVLGGGICLDDKVRMMEDEETAPLPSRKRRLLEEGTTKVNDESSICYDDDSKDEDDSVLVSRYSTHHSAKRTRPCEDERK